MKILLKLIYQMVLGFFATIGFAVYFYAPLNSIIATGFAGGLSWLVYYLVLNASNNKIVGTFGCLPSRCIWGDSSHQIKNQQQYLSPRNSIPGTWCWKCIIPCCTWFKTITPSSHKGH